jgi:hypothetical protein
MRALSGVYYVVMYGEVVMLCVVSELIRNISQFALRGGVEGTVTDLTLL